MFARYVVPSMLVASITIVVGCQTPPKEPPKDVVAMNEARMTRNPMLQHMSDNAVMQEMAVYDMHFVPHTDELSATGERRLDQMVAILNVYGGTVRYQTESTDEEFVARRLAHVREYIEAWECPMDRVEIVAQLAGGRGLTGDEAMEILRRGMRPSKGGGAGAVGGAGGSAGGERSTSGT